MKIRDILASNGLDFQSVEKEFDDLFESPAMVSAAVRNCTTCARKEGLSYLRSTFNGTPEEFVVLATQLFTGCCKPDAHGAVCEVYSIALKFEEESDIKACSRCPMFLENLERQGKMKCSLCKEAMAKYYG
jgi:protein-arginine kinase activator protein McsA